MRTVSPDCGIAPAFLNVLPTSSTTLSLSKVTGGFLAVIPQPTALSVYSFNTVVLPPCPSLGPAPPKASVAQC